MLPLYKLTIVCCIISCPVIYAQSGGPPMLTDDPGTAAYKSFEINISVNAQVADATQWALPLIDVNYGLTERIQLKVEVPFLITSHTDKTISRRFGSPNAGIKFRFLDEDKHSIAVSTYPQVILSIDKEDDAAYKIPLQVHKSIGKFVFGDETGFIFFNSGARLFINGILVGYKASERAEVMAEWYFSNEPHTVNGFSNAGMRYKFSDKIVLLASAGTQVVTASDEVRTSFFFFAGIQLLMHNRTPVTHTDEKAQ
jgi:hypothetical protein